MMRTRPDVLVLGAGGVLGAAWMSGVLAGIEDGCGVDLRACEHFVGTSTGAIVAAGLAAGESPRRPARAGTEGGPHAGSAGNGADHAGPAGNGADHADPTASGAQVPRRPRVSLVPPPGGRNPTRPDLLDAPIRLLSGLTGLTVRTTRRAGAWAIALSSPAAPVALRLGEPGGALTRSAVLRLMPRAHGTLEELERAIIPIDEPFDGRLRIVAVRRDTGRRTVFGRPGAPRSSVLDAVLASCAAPWVVAPVRIAGRDYIDGAVWSPTNIDAAPAGRDTHVLCLNPIAGLTGPGHLRTVVRGASRSRALLESQALRARGARVRVLSPDAASGEAIGTDLMDRDRQDAALETGYGQGLAFAAR